jgi:hypothetical protein
VGVFSNRLLLWGIAFELLVALAIVYLPPLQSLLATESLSATTLLVTLPFPFIVWGADELRRYWLRRRAGGAGTGPFQQVRRERGRARPKVQVARGPWRSFTSSV